MLQLFFDFFSGRAKTRIYTTFLGWILITHADILFIAFFTDQTLIFEKTQMLKGEYVWSYIINAGWWTIVIEILRVFVAVIMTHIMIWKIPKFLSAKSYEQELEVEYILRKMKVRKEEALNVREKKAVKQQLDNLKSEKKAVVERAKLNDDPQNIKWEEEYKKFEKDPAFKSFTKILESYYEHNGKIRVTSPYGTVIFEIPGGTLKFADTNELVNISNGKITLTDKGKRFARNYPHYASR